MTSDPLYIGLSREQTSRVVQFLQLYSESLKTSKYPPHEYRADAIDGLIAEINKRISIAK